MALTSKSRVWSRPGAFGRALRRCAVVSVLGLLPAFAVTGADTAEDLEYRVKAAYLYNFARFVEWPRRGASAGRPFVIGILGENPFGSTLHETVRRKKATGRSLEVREVADLEKAARCDLLFVSVSERREYARILDGLDGAAIFTVSEADSFLDAGGMLSFVIERDRVRFDVNLDAVRKSGLDVSSQLLKVARQVRFAGK